MQFYGYKTQDVLNEFAVTFFSLVNSMSRIKGNDSLILLSINSAAFNGGSEGKTVAEQLQKQSKGNHGILQEVRNIKK